MISLSKRKVRNDRVSGNKNIKVSIIVRSTIAVLLVVVVFANMRLLNQNEAPESVPVVLETETEVTVPEILLESTTVAVETESESSAEEEMVMQATAELETESVATMEQTELVVSTTRTSDSKTRTPEQAAPPAETPVDTEAVAVPVENPDENGECQPEHTQQAENQPQGGDTNGEGAVYVPGFGYIENSGPNTVESAGSGEGDWDKQIGTMQ